MGDDIGHIVDEANRRGQEMITREPRAAAARYNAAARRVEVELTNGCTFAFPVQLVERLATASDADLAEVEILGLGFGLHWDRLDEDLSIPGVLAGIFGTHAWMNRLRAAKAGAASSPAKAAAARRNGRKGGRPRKAADS